MYQRKINTLVVAAVAAPLTLSAPVVHAEIIVPFTTIFNTDFTTAGTGGMRGSGTGAFTVSGATGPATKSFLYWHGPTNSPVPNANADVTINGTTVTGTNIGFSDDNFWDFQNSQAYRADTTSIITGDGNYNLTNFTKPSVEINGAAAAVFSNDGDASTKRDIVIFNGNDSNFASPFDPAGWDFTLNGINYQGGDARLTLFVSDGQNFGANDDGTLRVNGVALASGGIFQGDSLPGGTGPTGNGNLFDIKTFDITGFLMPGLNNLNITLDAGFNDAISAVAAFVDLPAGAAPPIAEVSEPATLALLALGLAGLGVGRWRRRI